jgi:hypothetical protein
MPVRIINVNNSDSIGILEQILRYQYTPLLMASLQVLTATAIAALLPTLLIPGVDAATLSMLVPLIIVNRIVAVTGTASTLYQSEHGLYGANNTDVAVSIGTTLIGTDPFLSEAMGLVNFFWTLSRTDLSNL